MTTTTTKVTNRDRYTQIIDVLTKAGADQDLIDFCENVIAQLDKKAAKAKETAAAKKDAPDELMDAIRDVLASLADDECVITADVVTKLAPDFEDISSSKVSNRLSRLVKAGEAESSDMKIPATEGSKARTVKAYRLVK